MRASVSHPRSRPRGAAGFSLIDLLVGMTVLAIALLSQVGSTLSSHRLVDAQGLRTEALGAARQVLSRLRADDDWASLYGRLALREELANRGHAPLSLSDGRGAWLPETYFPDFVRPPKLGDLGVLISVPKPSVVEGDAMALPVLRENVVAAAFGLPADLNTDGTIDGDPRNADYEVLPVIVRLRWRGSLGGVEELRLSTWLMGAR